MSRQSLEILETWVKRVNERDADGLMALYDPNAVLIPTFSNDNLNTPEKIRDYFESLAQSEALQVELHRRTIHERKHGEKLVILSGNYRWKILIEEELLTVEARYSILVDLEKQAPIIHHHSSQLPRMI